MSLLGYGNKKKGIDGFRNIVKKHIQAEQEQKSNKRAKDIAETIKTVNRGKAK